MRLLPLTLSLFALLVSPFASPSVAGVVFELETQDHDVSPPQLERTTIYAQGISLKMETAVGQRGKSDAMIFRGDRREMVVVDHAKRSYMVIDRQFAANMAGQLNQAAEQMKGLLDNIPAEQRAMIEQMTKNRGPQTLQPARPQVQVSNTGKQAKVYGYDCVLFVVSRNGSKVRDVWVTNWNNISGGRDLAATFDSMSEFMLELTSAFPVGADSPMDGSAFATIKQMGGFPVATREFRADGTVESESALRSAQSQRLSPADFQPPNGYQPDSMFGGGAPSGRPGQIRPGGR